LISQKIERTITKQTVKPFGIALVMARKKLAFNVSEKSMIIVH